MMDSAASQSLEGKLTTILIEAALKMISLTNSRIFLLIETENEGRCYGGQDNLCELYREGRLQPTSEDTELRVDSSTPSPLLASPPSSGNRANDASGSSETETKKPKKRRIQSDHLIANWPSETKKPKLIPLTLPDSSEDFSDLRIDQVGSREAIEIKTEIDPVIVGTEAAVLCNAVEDTSNGATICTTAESKAELKSQIYEFVADQIRTDFKIREKVEVVQNVAQVEVLKDCKSTEWKMLRSFFSIFGFQFAISSDDWKNKYEQNLFFQTLWDFFPNLHPHLDMKMTRRSGHSPSLLSYCREAFFCRIRGREYREAKIAAKH